MARLGDYIQQIRGVSYKPEDVYDELNENSVPLLRANNIQDDKLNLEDVIYVGKKKVKEIQYLKAGDILVCTSSGSKDIVGKAAYIEKDLPMTFGAFCKVIRTNIQMPKYMGYFFDSPYYRRKIFQAAAGANINNIRKEDIDRIEICLPVISHQKHIIVTLDFLNNLIELRKRQIKKLDELIKSKFEEMLENVDLSDEKTIAEITDRVKVGFVGACEKYYTDNSGIPMIRTGNITENGIDFKNLKYVTDDFHKKNIKSQIHEGDLLIARHGANGQAIVYTGPDAQCLNVVVIEPNQEIVEPVFLASLINSPGTRVQIERTLVGSTQNVLNTKSIANLTVKIPSISVQKEYGEFYKLVRTQRLKVQAGLNSLVTLKQVLMQQYFG